MPKPSSEKNQIKAKHRITLISKKKLKKIGFKGKLTLIRLKKIIKDLFGIEENSFNRVSLVSTESKSIKPNPPPGQVREKQGSEILLKRRHTLRKTPLLSRYARLSPSPHPQNQPK